MEWQLITKFHVARSNQLSSQVVDTIMKAPASGIFEHVASCRNLWHEVSWALQESQDKQAVEAAADTIDVFAKAVVAGLMAEEIKLHCYIVTDDQDDEGLPYDDREAVIKDLAERVRGVACSFCLSHLGK
jgi:hypothetical protein